MIGLIPEQTLIATMVLDMVDYLGGSYDAHLGTPLAKRVISEVLFSVDIPALGDTVAEVVARTAGLPA